MLRNKTAFSKMRKNDQVRPAIVPDWLVSGPAEGLLFQYLNSLDKHAGHFWGVQDVASRSSSAPVGTIPYTSIHSMPHKDRLAIFHPPPLLSTESNALLKESPYKDLKAVLDYYGNSCMSRLEEIADGAEIWAILHYGLLRNHYISKQPTKRQRFYAYIISHNTISLRMSTMATTPCSNDLNCVTHDDLQKCRLACEAVSIGLGRAQITVTEAAFHAHDILRGTVLDNVEGKIRHWLPSSEGTDVNPDLLSWTIQLYEKPSGNIALPPDVAHAKGLCAIGWLMGCEWVVATSNADMKNNGVNYIISL